MHWEWSAHSNVSQHAYILPSNAVTLRFLSMYINVEHILHVTPAPAKLTTGRDFQNMVVFRVSVWSRDPLAEIVLSSDDIGQGEQPQWLDPQLALHNSNYWILNDQPLGKLMGYHSKQALSQVWWKWQWQERERKKELRAKTLSTLSVIYWSCRAAGAQGSAPPLSLFLCTHLTPVWKEQQQLLNLKHFCPTGGFMDKGLSM